MNGEQPQAEKKTVEEILKEQGVIQPIPKERIEGAKPPEEEADSKKIIMSLEKIRTEIDMLKDEKRQVDERIRDITESIGEIRSLIFQRETLIKETESKVRLLDEAISDIRPQRYMKEMDLRREEIEQTQVRIEKLETMSKELLRDVQSSKERLENIKSVENMEKILKEIEENVTKGREVKSDIDRLAGKAERFYIEMENRIKQFSGLTEKVENVDGLTKELTRSVDEINIRMGAFAAKEDVDAFRRTIDEVILSNREKIEAKIEEIENVIKVPSKEIKIKMEELRRKESTVQKLLENIEEQYRVASISQNAYTEIKDKNEKLIEGIREEIKKLEGEEKISIKTLPVVIDEIYNNIDSLKEKVDKLGGGAEAGEEVTGTLKAQTEMMKNVLEKFKETSQRITEIDKEIKSCNLRLKLFDILDMLIRTENKEDISYYISELEKTISEMKEIQIWENKKGEMIHDLLRDLAENWKEYGYDDIAQIFEGELGKFNSEIYKYLEEY